MRERKLTKDRLLDDITKKDRRFRIAQSSLYIGVILALVAIIAVQSITLSEVKEQTRRANTTTEEVKHISEEVRRNSEVVKAGNEILSRHLNCIVVFFQQPDRANVTIEDINQCTFNKNADLTKSFLRPPSEGGEPPGIENLAQDDAGTAQAGPGLQPQGRSSSPTPPTSRSSVARAPSQSPQAPPSQAAPQPPGSPPSSSPQSPRPPAPAPPRQPSIRLDLCVPLALCLRIGT